MTALGDLLAGHIRDRGPVAVSDFMAQCLGHPDWGYYRTRDPLGGSGDFTTSPEISQMFGELIGLWAGVVWQSMGSPDRVLLVELGPGRGTLMADALRAAAMLPAFRRALCVHLIEINPALKARQRETLKDERILWLEDLNDLPPGPAIVIANEFFDALPIEQFIRTADGWRRRMVTLDDDGRFAFAPGPLADIDAPPAGPGDIFEIGNAARAVASGLGRRLSDQGGAALVIDYGHAESAIGDTLQAVRHHRYAEIFDAPGETDLTAHVDFAALARAAAPAIATPTVTQGTFLRSLGIELRADRLIKSAPQKADMIATACRRLIEPAGMGTLFKVRALTHPGLPIPPGFIL
ncbi:MAG: class I SAM-dependent methyltransferase [Telmatospirillum sp.]|nr:class I SAM-dependent methyltransferase [Telmatospirillum sp.]